MHKLKDNNRFLLNQQADIIRKLGVMVAKRHTLFFRKELYAIDELLVELSFTQFLKTTSLEGIKPIRNSDELELYCNKSKLLRDP